jgi:hypothetical protein
MPTARPLLIVGAVVVVASVPAVGIVTAQRTHFATHGHYITYGWHVDVDTVTPEPGTEELRPSPSGLGIEVPVEGQRATIVNFTFFPDTVEACMSGAR